jgi:hypothetical protein
MDKQTFSALPFHKRCDLLLEKGRFLDSVNYYRFKAYLFCFDSFFVEVLRYQDSAVIEKVQVASEDNLVKFLNRIDVNDLLEKL